jgi:hypothetical protein
MLQNYINKEETERAQNNTRVDLRYKGPRPSLQNKKGKGYFIANENPVVDGQGNRKGFEGQWYFIPNGSTDTFRVKTEHLDFEK